MRLDFNVLWVDDQQPAVEAQRDRLSRTLRGHGFRLQVKFASSVDEAMACMSDDIYTDHIDLVLMDYDLGAGPMGDVGLAKVRNLLPHRDIIFYSAGADDLWSKVSAAKVEGVYCSTRAELPDKAEGIFEALVKKVIDIDHARGIVMGATSDIDHFVFDCLAATFEKCNDAGKTKALGLIKSRMAEIRKRFEKEAAAIEAATHVSQLGDKHAVYTSVDRLNLLRKLLSEVELHADKEERLGKYVQETVPKRNVMAHVRVRIEGFSRKLIRSDGSELTSAEMALLRRELLEYHELFEEIHYSLVPAS